MRERILEALKSHVHYDPDLVLTSGGRSDFYVDVKEACAMPIVRRWVVDELDALAENGAVFIAANGHGGISLATELSTRREVYLTMVRDEPKKHARRNLIEGFVPKRGDCGIIVDDVLSTGGTIAKIADVLHGVGARVLGAYVVVKRGDAEQLRRFDFPVKHLFDVEEVL